MTGKIRLVLGPATIMTLVMLFVVAGQPQSAVPTGIIKNKVILRELAFQSGRKLPGLGVRDQAAKECGGQKRRDTPDQRGLRAELDVGWFRKLNDLRVS